MKEKSSKWSPEVHKAIQKMHTEFKQKVIESSGNLILDQKVKSLYELCDKKYQDQCKDKMSELKKYVQEGKDDEYLAIPGKENEAQQAILELEVCRKPYINIISNFSFISQYTKKMYHMQTDFCYQDCSKLTEDKLMSCLRNCTENSIRYSLRAYTELLANTADNFKDELEKL